MNNFFLKSIILLFVSLGININSYSASNLPAYKNPSLSPKERAADLLPRLTLEEKVSLMMDVSPAIERLGIPSYNWWNEALHGVGRAGLATVFPQSIGLAATFDPSAVEESFTIVSDEARAKYNYFRSIGDHERYKGLTFWTPNINIFRDPRWGRGQETYGEDPYLTTELGRAVVRGLQGDNEKAHIKTIACAKHFAVHSGPEWNRHSYDAKDIWPEDLWSTYLPAFHALVDEGVGQVMCAYNRFDGEPCCGNQRLLTKILREEWGYDGIVVSDCWALNDFFLPGFHETHKDGVETSAAAVMAGTDLECGPVFSNLVDAVKSGQIDESKIDESLMRLLIARFALGEMDNEENEWSYLDMSYVDTPEHQEKSLEMARKSMTLLKNNGILPLSRQDSSVVVIGPNAADSLMQLGNYNGTPSHIITILEGVKSKLPGVRYFAGCSHVEDNSTDNHEDSDETEDQHGMTGAYWFDNLASTSENRTSGQALPDDFETVVFVGGITPRLEGEEMPVTLPGFKGGDRTSIELPEVQRNFLQELKKRGKKIIFVNCSGSAMALTPEDSICDAILQAWYPGQAGGQAVADVIFGDYNPGGRLPVTFYKDDSQLPDYESYDMEGRTYRYLREKPLYPFGYGLSYSDFIYSDAEIISIDSDNFIFQTEVLNNSDREGDEVVQLYIKKDNETGGPIKTLRGFKRVTIPAGQKMKVEIPLTGKSFETFDHESERMKVTPGLYHIYYGGSSDTDRSITYNLN